MESFSSLTITIFPSFKIKKTNEYLERHPFAFIVYCRKLFEIFFSRLTLDLNIKNAGLQDVII